jgi:hypothetical protein
MITLENIFDYTSQNINDLIEDIQNICTLDKCYDLDNKLFLDSKFIFYRHYYHIKLIFLSMQDSLINGCFPKVVKDYYYPFEIELGVTFDFINSNYFLDNFLYSIKLFYKLQQKEKKNRLKVLNFSSNKFSKLIRMLISTFYLLN